MALINWDSVPDYDEWGIDTHWSCEEWMTYHKRLDEHFGKETANDIWNYAYAKSGNLSSNLDCRTLNSAFREYVNKNRLSPYANAGIFTPVLKTYGTASDIFEGALTGASSVFSGNTFKILLNVALIGGGVLGVVYVYNSVKNK